MNATIAATATANERKSGSAIARAIGTAMAFVRNAIKEYGAPYLNGPLPPL
jgi:hypothetical protein